MSLSQETIAIVKSTAPVLAEHGETITRYFYQQMLTQNLELLDIFNSANQQAGDQQRALAAAVYGYAANIDNLGALTNVVQRIAHKHVSLNLKPEHYSIVGKHLLEAIAHVLGEAATPEILTAWAEAYDFLANIFIEMEEGIYTQKENEVGGWRGLRQFKVVQKVKESSCITSFYFEPVDGIPVLDFTPGQYIGLYLNPEGHPYREIRQYSLSDAPNGKYYRISVKRELSDKGDGLVSNYLHDHIHVGDVVELSTPAGSFYMDCDTSAPVVLLSGGVGLTPMLSMFNTLLGKGDNRQIRYIHGAINEDSHAFAGHVSDKAAANDNVCSFVFYEKSKKDANNNIYSGRINLDLIREQVELSGAHYYFCGPIGFMRAVNDTLRGWGVAEEHIHYEVFGPHKSLDTHL